MGQVSFRRVLLLAGTSSLILVYLILWGKMIVDPVQRSATDFIAYYAAGRVARSAGFSHVYDAGLIQLAQERVVGFPLLEGQVLLYNNVPFLVPVVALFAGDNYAVSFLAWSLIMLLCFLAAISLLGFIFHDHGWKKPDILTTCLGLLVFFPLFISLLNGQNSGLTTLGLSLWLYGLLSRRWWLAGLGLALVTVRPQVALVLSVPFLFKYRKVFLWFAVGAGSLMILGWLAVGSNGMHNFLQTLLVSARGSFFGMQEGAMVNLIGMLIRIFPAWHQESIHWVGWIAYLLILVLFSFVWEKTSHLDERYYGLAVCAALFFSPHLHYHDAALLIVPISCLVLYITRGGLVKAHTSSLIPLILSLFLILASLVPGIKFNLPILLMLFLAVSPWIWNRFTLPAARSSQENG